MRGYKRLVELLITAVLIFSAVRGIMRIYSFVETIENNTNVFYASEENGVVGVKYNEKVQNNAQNAAKKILDSGIKTKISEISAVRDIIICYTKNVYMELDTNSMCPVLMFYECAEKEIKLSEEECRSAAMSFVFKNVPRRVKTANAEIRKIESGGSVASYEIYFADKTVRVSVRRDTGSIVFYDGSELFF